MQGRGIRRFLTVSILGIVLSGSVCWGQSQDLIKVLPTFYLNGVTLDNQFHRAHFHDTSPFPATQSMVALSTILAAQSATYPTGSSSGAFVLESGSGGLPKRASETFGPMFAERALTLGRGKFNAGLTFVGTKYDRFDNLSLADGDMKVVLIHEDIPPAGRNNPGFEGDIIPTRLDLGLQVSQTVFFLNYGITKRLDIGIVLPWVNVELDAKIDTVIERLNTGANSCVHSYNNAECLSQTGNRGSRATFTDGLSGSASGIGDAALRLKYNFYRTEETGLGFYFDLRAPTGDEQNLLGLGAWQGKAMFVGSWELGPVSPLFNVGYTASSGNYTVDFGDVSPNAPKFIVEPADEVNFSVGANFAASKKVTLSMEWLTRRILETTTVTSVSDEFSFYPVGTNINDPANLTSVPRDQLSPATQDVDVSLGAAGVKWNVSGKWMLKASLIVPFGSNDGLEDSLAGTLGFEAGF